MKNWNLNKGAKILCIINIVCDKDPRPLGLYVTSGMQTKMSSFSCIVLKIPQCVCHDVDQREHRALYHTQLLTW